MPSPDGSAAFAGHQLTSADLRRDDHRGLGPMLGLALSAAGSIALWVGLAHAARWAAQAFL